MTRFTAAAFNALIGEDLPWAAAAGMRAERIDVDGGVLRLPFDEAHIRPGDTVSGPTMMALADATMYAVVLGAVGEVRLAVTTSFNINFLRRAGRNDLIAEGRLIKLGKRLAVVEVTLFPDHSRDPVAHATGTYSIPPDADSQGEGLLGL